MSKRSPLLLVVDDDSDVLDALRCALEDEGYRVSTASNGHEALGCLSAAEVPSLILLDLMMPVMDGFAFRAAQLADATMADVPVIVLSAGALGQDLERLRPAAALKKPVPLSALLSTVGRLVAATAP
jgi:CheY-like chemotaxis protein